MLEKLKRMLKVNEIRIIFECVLINIFNIIFIIFDKYVHGMASDVIVFMWLILVFGFLVDVTVSFWVMWSKFK